MSGISWDNGKENGNYCLGFRAFYLLKGHYRQTLQEVDGYVRVFILNKTA